MFMFVLGVSITLNGVLGLILFNLKSNINFKECIEDEEAFKDFEKKDEKFNDFFFNSK